MLTLTQVRLHELFHSRARNSNPILLGDPQHAIAKYSWAKTAVRLATDGNGYTFREFEEEYGERSVCRDNESLRRLMWRMMETFQMEREEIPPLSYSRLASGSNHE